MTASILQQLLGLYFAIIYSWQLSSSEKSLVGKKFIHTLQEFYRFRFLLHRYFLSFSLINACLLCRLRKAYVLPWAFAVLLARRHLHRMLLTNFENLNSISNIFQETHDFLVLTNPLIIFVYLRTTDKHFCDQGNSVIPPQSY